MRSAAPSLFLLLLAACLACGCLESRDTTALKADGSGTVSIRYEVNRARFRELIDRVALLFRDASGMLQGTEPDLVARGWVEMAARAAKGYEITRYAEKTTEQRRVTEIEAAFDSLQAAAVGGAFPVSSVTLEKVLPADDAPAGAPASWRLTFEPSYGTAREASGMNPLAIVRMFEAQVKGSKVVRALTLPTSVLETNGARGEDGKTVTWTVDYEALRESKERRYWVRFADREGLALRPFEHKPNLASMTHRLTMKPPRVPPKESGGEEKPGTAPGDPTK